jgi:hypothetical protein
MSEELRSFVELMDDYIHECLLDADLWAYREERRLAAVLHAQVQQFFQGLEAALPTSAGETRSRARLLQSGLARAEQLGVEPREGDPDLFLQFAYMDALSRGVHFDAGYGAGFAPDGSISILVGPDLPAFEELGIGGSQEHDCADLRTAIALARCATDTAARIAVLTKYGTEEQRGLLERLPASLSPVPGRSEEDVAAAEPSGDQALRELIAKATAHFRTWYFGSEDALLRHLVNLLAQHGLLQCGTELDRAKSAANVMTVWALHVELAARTGEGTPGEWVYSVGAWHGDGISTDQLALLNDHFGLGWPFGEDEQEVSLSDVCVDLVREHRAAVVDVLRQELGDSTFAYFWAARLEEVAYPLDGDLLDDILNHDLDDKVGGFQWVESGMDL